MHRSPYLDTEDFSLKLSDVLTSPTWVLVEKMFAKARNIYLFGNGGNMAVADHMAIDMSRLTDKNVICPGSAVLATSIISDTNFEDWFKHWLEIRRRHVVYHTLPGVGGVDLAIGFSCSTIGASSNATLKALEWASQHYMNAVLITAQDKANMPDGIYTINQNVVHYHTAELLSLALGYQLIHSAGFDCPTIQQKADARLGL